MIDLVRKVQQQQSIFYENSKCTGKRTNEDDATDILKQAVQSFLATFSIHVCHILSSQTEAT